VNGIQQKFSDLSAVGIQERQEIDVCFVDSVLSCLLESRPPKPTTEHVFLACQDPQLSMAESEMPGFPNLNAN
jgi:hypothetical protein